MSFHGLRLKGNAGDGSAWDSRTCTNDIASNVVCSDDLVVDKYSGKPVYIQYQAGVEYALGIDSLVWEPGFCLNFKLYVYGLDWKP